MKISVITVAYDSGSTLRHAIESVLHQTWGNIEYIIVDGASEDNTLDIVREYEPRFNGRLRWISEPDGGIYDAMNKGLSMATGDVVGFLNSDDFFSSDRILERVAMSMHDRDIDAVYGDVHYVNEADLSKCVRYYSSRCFRRWQMRLGFMPAHPSFYCRRMFYQKYGVFDASYQISADFELFLRFLYIHRIRARYLPLDFVTMRTGGASTLNSRTYRKRIQEHLRAYRKNNVHSNFFLDNLRFPYKLLRVVSLRLKMIFRFYKK